jgi:glucose-6-phosphate dehydrogenase assembly protein OpcA
MSHASALNTVFLGQEVPLGRVPKALRELWADESAGTRASLMNFAIYSEEPLSLEKNTVLLASLMREHSCRSLLILNVPGVAKPQTRAWVTAHCQLTNGKKSVCCEQLSFVIEGGTADQVRNTIFAHLDSDLPLVVWWQGELTERFDERFASVIDSLIIDSSQWCQPAKTMRQVLELRRGGVARFSLSDLAWMRSHFMRVALAAACQSAVVLVDLPKLNMLKVVHAPAHRMSALMLVAWIGTQLKCTLIAGEALQLERRDGETITIVLEEGPADCPLQELQLSGSKFSIGIKRDPSSSFVHATLDHPQAKRDDVQPADQNDDAELIGVQLSRLGGTTRYFEVIPLLQRLLDHE